LNRELVFEYSAQFADQLQPITQDVSWHAYLTYADICRARYVGKKFLEVLWSDFDRLLKTTHAIREQPALSLNPSLGNAQRATHCLRQIIEILDFARVRWGLPQMRHEFEQESAVLFSRLKSRQTDFAPPQYSSTMVKQSPGQASLHYYPDANQYVYDQAGMSEDQKPALQQDFNYQTNRQQQQQISTPPEEYNASNAYLMPQGSLPRRSYEFYGRGHR
jgi:hypothetical protein